MMKKFLFTLLLLTCFLFSPIIFAQHKPNIILIVADDHGKDALGAYGNPVIQTPALDALG